MERFTRLSRLEIEAIAADYAIHNIQSFEVLSGGWENTNYLVHSEKGRFVLTLSEQKSATKARELARLLQYLEANNFRTSRIITNIRKEAVGLWEERPILMKSFVEGEVRESLPLPLVGLAGRELARLHKIKAPDFLNTQVNYGKEQFSLVEKYAADSLFDDWLKEKLNYLSPYFALDLPRALIHCDVFADNVVVSDDEKSLSLVDFEEAAHYYRIFDVGMTIIGLCAETDSIDLEKARKLLAAYRQETPLLDEELAALHAFTIYAGASMTFWRHKNFNYIQPDPNRANHYLELKKLTDFIEKQSSDCFIKQ